MTDGAPRSEILDEAKHLITQDRAEAYGSFDEQAHGLANMWSVITGHPILPQHVAAMLIAMKLYRTTQSNRPDNYVDICGYAALGGELASLLEEEK